MNDLSSKYEEFGVLYPNLCKLAAIALTVPLSSVNCKRDFSTMNMVRVLYFLTTTKFKNKQLIM